MRHHVPHDGFDSCVHYAPSYRWQSRSRYCACAGFLSATPGVIRTPSFEVELILSFLFIFGFIVYWTSCPSAY